MGAWLCADGHNAFHSIERTEVRAADPPLGTVPPLTVLLIGRVFCSGKHQNRSLNLRDFAFQSLSKSSHTFSRVLFYFIFCIVAHEDISLGELPALLLCCPSKPWLQPGSVNACKSQASRAFWSSPAAATVTSSEGDRVSLCCSGWSPTLQGPLYQSLNVKG